MFINKKFPRYLGLISGLLAFCIMGYLYYYNLSGARGSVGVALGYVVAMIVTPIIGIIFGILGYSVGLVIYGLNNPAYRQRAGYQFAIIMIIIILFIIFKLFIIRA